MGSTGPVTSLIALARAALREPFGRRARGELLYCLVGVLVGLAVLAVIVALLVPGTAESVIRAAVITAVLVPLALATGMARRLGAAHRRLAERLLGKRVAPPPPASPRPGLLGRLGAGLRDGPGWRALAYTLLKPPIAMVELYAVFLWADGLANLTYPFWWGMFRNHPPGVRLSPVLVGTPFPGRVPRRHLSRHVPGPGARRDDGARRPLGDQGGRLGGPLAPPGPARPGQARRAGPRPGADPGAGGG